MIHVTWILANNSSAPYFNWFAEIAAKKKEMEFSVVCLYKDPPEMIEDLKKFGIKCYWIKYDYNKRKTGIFKSTIALYFLFKKIKPTVIHSHLFDDSLAALIAGKIAGIKHRVITKGDAGFHYLYTPQWVIFDKFNNYMATRIVTISSENKTFILEKERADPSKVVVIHHGLPLLQITSQFENYKNEFRELWQLENKIVIGTLSRFIEWKGYKKIVNAVEILIQTHPKLLFLFTGAGPQKYEIEKSVKEKGLEKHIVFTNWINPKKIPSLFGVMDIYLHAAENEPFGLVIAEAMLNGVPVVSTSTGAAADAIKHKKNGYLCSPASALELAGGVKYILQHNLNNCIGAAGKETAEQLFSIERMYSNHIALYKQQL